MLTATTASRYLVSELLLNSSVSVTGSFPECLQFPMGVTDVTLPVLLQRAIREMTQPGTQAGVVKYMQFTHTHKGILCTVRKRQLNRPVGFVGRTPLSRGRVKNELLSDRKVYVWVYMLTLVCPCTDYGADLGNNKFYGASLPPSSAVCRSLNHSSHCFPCFRSLSCTTAL